MEKFKLNEQSNAQTVLEYNMLMGAMNVSVSKHLLDEYFTVVWANDYFYKLLLYTKAEYEAAFHNHPTEFFADNAEDLAMVATEIKKMLAEGRTSYTCFCKMRQKNGNFIWTKVSGAMNGEMIDGSPILYTVYTDVTEAVEQKQLQLQLEKRSQELSAALVMAEAANHAKSDFLSRMSHDIRTPMNAIMGMTDIALAHLHNPDKIEDSLRKIALSSQHLLGLINDVLDMSKIESGKMTLAESEMELAEVMEIIVSIIQTAVKSKRQHFDVRLHNIRHELLYCDALRLRQVLINVLSNASKFTPEGGRISFDITETPAEQVDTAWFEFKIADTGIGISEGFIKDIFQPFSREKDSRVDKIDGSGLGMAISQKIVDVMGGTISVSSTVGVGTIFTIKLPLQICETSLEELHFPALKLIVVDDDEAVCEHTTQLLQQVGIKAEWETSGTAAVCRVGEAHAQGADYDAVILDCKMPEQDGLATARMIREIVGAELPIILISAYDAMDIEEQAQQVGVNGFIMKPVFLSTLCRSLQRYVLGKNAASAHKMSEVFTGKRILLVEDNDLNREIAVEILSSAGAEVDSAGDGVEGVEKFALAPVGYYDLILMDIQMPRLNGYEATKQIRHQLTKDDALTVPIVAMTADAFAEDIAEAKKAGMNGHLAKPLDMRTLTYEISKYLR